MQAQVSIRPRRKVRRAACGFRVIGATLVAVGFLVSGCQPALRADYGYPADWPPPVSLGTGLSELAGSYANEGTATTAKGGFTAVRLTDLLPEGRPHEGLSKAEVSPAPIDSARLAIVPPDRWPQPYPRLRAIVTTADGVTVHETESGSGQNALMYDLQLDGRRAAALGFEAGQAAVMLTKGADGSLIARIHSQPTEVLTAAQPGTQSSVWAKFEPVSP